MRALSPVHPGSASDDELFAALCDAAVLDDESWRSAAACREQPLEWFFPPEDPSQESSDVISAEAQGCCESCPVRVRCLFEAIRRREQHGVWGGVTPRGLRRWRQRLAAAGVRFADGGPVTFIGAAAPTPTRDWAGLLGGRELGTRWQELARLEGDAAVVELPEDVELVERYHDGVRILYARRREVA